VPHKLTSGRCFERLHVNPSCSRSPGSGERNQSLLQRLSAFQTGGPLVQIRREAWELDGAAKAERLLRNRARTLERQAPGVAGAILEGLDEILTVVRLGLPKELR